MAVALANVQVQRFSPTTGDCMLKMMRILLIHGCPLYQVGLRSFLMQQGDCQLMGEASSQEEALLLAKEEQPDVVLLDGGLTSALEIMRQLRQLGEQGFLVFAPPMGDEETLFQFLLHGARAYIDSSVSEDELLKTMRRVAQGECLITGDVLLIQAAQRERIARLAEALLSAEQRGNSTRTGWKDDIPLSTRERAVLQHIAKGSTNVQVAQALGISHYTVKNYLEQVFQKLQVPNRTSAVVTALRRGWITL